MRLFARSIRHRLLIVIIATVVGTLLVHDLVAVREVRRMALAVATDRLRTVSGQLGGMLQSQAQAMQRQLAVTANQPEIREFLKAPASRTRRDTATSVLRRQIGINVVGLSVWGPTGESLLDVGSPQEHDAAFTQEVMAATSGANSTTITRMSRVRDSIGYAAVTRVSDGARPLGYVLSWRRTALSTEASRQLSALIGSDAGVYAGNTGDTVWTNFRAFVPRPRFPLTSPNGGEGATLTTYDRPGAGSRLAAARTLAGTPWTIVIEFPTAYVFEPVRSMVGRLLLATVPALLLTFVVAWWFAARLTTPLRDLASAATGISAGDYSRRAVVGNRDEVGTLAGAFNHMAESIGSAHRALEERAEELAHRASQLEEQAGELEITNEELADSITVITRTRDELASVTAELDACLASAPVGIALHDPQGRYRRVNASLAKLHGVDVDAHAGRLPSEVFPGLGSQLEQHVRSALASGNQVLNVQLTTDEAANGATPSSWLASVFPIRTPDGESLGVGSVVTDLTAYKELERQLLQSQKMEAVGRLAGGVAHDFNNILTAISGFGQFVLSDLDGSHAATRADIEQVLAAAERGGALTRQLLAFSRQQVLQPRVLDLNVVVTSLGPMLARLIGTDVNLRTTASPRLSAVKADPNQMEQVLVNLVVNARDAMPNGGTIMIETADVELDESYASQHSGVAPGRYVMLAVTDSGMGMDAATRARAFDPFFTTKEAGKGTGLGLSTVYGIVKQSGGNIEVYSEPGQGTSFKVYLPKCVEIAAEMQVRVPVPTSNRRATVLLVDDDIHVSATARRALERAGYQVLSAPNGNEGLRIAADQNGTLDLLITDMVMPGMGGRELARRVVGARPGIRVLYTSGYTAQAMNQQAILEPGDAFLGKPFTPDALLRRVDEVLNPATVAAT